MPQSERVKRVLGNSSSAQPGDLFVLRADELGPDRALVEEHVRAFAELHGVRFLIVPPGVELEHLGRDEVEALGYRWVGTPEPLPPSPCCEHFCPHVHWFDKFQSVVQCCRCGRTLDAEGGDGELRPVGDHGDKLSSRCLQPPIPRACFVPTPECPVCHASTTHLVELEGGDRVCGDCADASLAKRNDA